MQIEQFTDMLVSTSPDEICCNQHIDIPIDKEEKLNCVECLNLKEKVNKYQNHRHTATCAKKGKLITIKSNEGHGQFDGTIKGKEMKNIQVCRFSFPRYPLDETTLIIAIPKDADEDMVKKRKQDLRKIVTYLIRQTSEQESFEAFQKLSFYEFLYSVGMFKGLKTFEDSYFTIF